MVVAVASNVRGAPVLVAVRATRTCHALRLDNSGFAGVWTVPDSPGLGDRLVCPDCHRAQPRCSALSREEVMVVVRSSLPRKRSPEWKKRKAERRKNAREGKKREKKNARRGGRARTGLQSLEKELGAVKGAPFILHGTTYQAAVSLDVRKGKVGAVKGSVNWRVVRSTAKAVEQSLPRLETYLAGTGAFLSRSVVFSKFSVPPEGGCDVDPRLFRWFLDVHLGVIYSTL